MPADAQNLNNSALFCLNRAGYGSKRRNSGRKKTISDLKQCKREWFNNFQRTFLENNMLQSWLTAKFELNVLVTAISRHVRDLLNIGEGKSCFSLPEDLTVKDYFCYTKTGKRRK